jgi:hypothetical protein
MTRAVKRILRTDNLTQSDVEELYFAIRDAISWSDALIDANTDKVFGTHGPARNRYVKERRARKRILRKMFR